MLTIVDGKGMIASPEDALDVADELLDLALELKEIWGFVHIGYSWEPAFCRDLQGAFSNTPMS